MLYRYAALYLVIGHSLTEKERKLFEWGVLRQKDTDVLGPDDHMHQESMTALALAKRACEFLPLGKLEKEIDRALKDNERSAMRDRLQQEITRLYKRFCDELEDLKFLYVPPERVQFFGQKELFGADVVKKFPTAAEDIEHAGNCYALGESTATVLHLMRAMEAAVARLSKRLKATIVPQDTWGQMLSKMDTEIRKLPESTSAQKVRKENWSAARANLYHVKEAWRNPGMHPKRTYTLEQAKEVLDAVRVFMRGLAQL